MHQLSRSQIIAALSSLNDKLATKGVTGELCIFGGAAMVLVFDARPNTRDVDAIFVPKGELAEAAEAVGAEMSLPAGWLNDGVKGFASPAGKLTEDDLPRFSHLRLMRPTARYLLAMKCLAARIGGYDAPKDREDVLLPVKTRFFVEEIAQELQS